jgi:hypothetical protein
MVTYFFSLEMMVFMVKLLLAAGQLPGVTQRVTFFAGDVWQLVLPPII